MDTDGYVVLPVTASFSDASPNLNFNDSGDNSDVIATLSYTYAGQTIGSTNLYMTESTDSQAFPFSNTETSGEEGTEQDSAQNSSQKKIIKINLRLILYAAAAVAAVIIFILLGKKIAKDYSIHFDFLTKWRKRADRNSFSNKKRKRYKSKKRWKNNFFKKFK